MTCLQNYSLKKKSLGPETLFIAVIQRQLFLVIPLARQDYVLIPSPCRKAMFVYVCNGFENLFVTESPVIMVMDHHVCGSREFTAHEDDLGQGNPQQSIASIREYSEVSSVLCRYWT